VWSVGVLIALATLKGAEKKDAYYSPLMAANHPVLMIYEPGQLCQLMTERDARDDWNHVVTGMQHSLQWQLRPTNNVSATLKPFLPQKQ